jgi:hypothetical protein
MCPTAEDSGMLMSSVVINVHMCWQDGGKRGQWGLIKGTENEAVDFETGGQQRQKSAASYKEPPFQVRGLSFCIYKHHTCN